MWQRWARGGFLALTVILAAFLFYLLVIRMESVPTPSSASPGLPGRADAGVGHFTFTQSRAGTVQWEVKAQRAHVFEAQNRANLDQVRVTLYGSKGWELKLEGDEGTIDLASKDFTLARRGGPIAVRLESGYTVYTNHLLWKDERREVSTKEPVTLSGHGLTVTGRGLIGKLDIEEFRVLDDVRVEIVH